MFSFIADIHLGNHRRFGGPMVCGMNDRARLALDVLREAHDYAHGHSEHMVVCGDVLDLTMPTPQLLAEIQQAMDQPPEKTVIVGNHDQVSTLLGDHALGVLNRGIGCTVVEPGEGALLVHVIDQEKPGKKRHDAAVLCVPFKPGPAGPWIAECLEKFADQFPDLDSLGLAIHAGIKDEQTPPWLSSAPDAIGVDELDALCSKYGIAAVFAGNWHDRRIWRGATSNAHIVQVGALVPTGFDNPGLTGYGTVATWDPTHDSVQTVEFPGPRFVKVLNDLELDKALEDKGENKLFIEMSVPPEELHEANMMLSKMVESGMLAGARALPDQSVATAQARTAARAAQSSATLEEALHAFVSEMPLPEGVERDKVLVRTKAFL